IDTPVVPPSQRSTLYSMRIATSCPLASLDSRSRFSRHAFCRHFASLSLRNLSNGYLHVCPA
ncbi:hypothetical protein BDN71DRAFT_1456059, partial [Pleurotus eryngii]